MRLELDFLRFVNYLYIAVGQSVSLTGYLEPNFVRVLEFPL